MTDPNRGGAFDRLGKLVELVTTLDIRVTNALEGLEEMRSSVTGFDPAREDVRQLVADLRARIEALDARLHRDLDDVKALLIEKLGGLDLDGLGPRFDRLEEAIYNIERATTSLDGAIEGGLDILPDFLSRRLSGGARKDGGAPPGDDALTHEDLGH